MIKKSLLYLFCCVSLCLYSTCIAKEPLINDAVYSPTNCYTLQQELGEGAFGKVFLVEDSQGKQFAMKWYKEEVYETEDSAFNLLGDAQREFERGQALSHPNIIQAYELFSDATQENHFLILDFVGGKTLHRTTRKSLSDKDSFEAALQLAQAMFYSYSQEYLYLDMHAGNLMIDADTNVKVIDLAGFFSFEEINLLYNKGAQKKGIEAVGLEKKIEQQFGPKRANILKRFLQENPEFSKHFQKNVVHKDVGALYMPDRWLFVYWLDRLTDRQVDILMKSDMERDDRLDVREKIKRLAWEYSEDVADGVSTPPMDVYFERLEAILN